MIFAEWVSAYTAGYIARREGLDDLDGEAFLRAIHDAYQDCGQERARHNLPEGRDGDPSATSPAVARQGSQGGDSPAHIETGASKSPPGRFDPPTDERSEQRWRDYFKGKREREGFSSQ